MKHKYNFVKEYINRVVYLVYVVLARMDNDKGRDIDDLLFYLHYLNDKEKRVKIVNLKKKIQFPLNLEI